MQTRSRHVAILAFDEVDLLDIAGPLQILSIAGRHWNWRPFVVHVAALESQVTTSARLRVQCTTTLQACPPCEILLVPGGYGAHAASKTPEIIAWLRARAVEAQLMACVADGCLPLAAAGLLDGQLVAAPIASHHLLRALTPDCQLSEKTSVFGSRLLSARSGTQGALLGLALVSRLLGTKLGAALGAQLDLAWSSEPSAPTINDVVIIEGSSTPKPAP